MSDVAALLTLMLVPGLPLLLALGLMLLPRAGWLQQLAIWSPLPGLAVSLMVAPGTTASVPWLLLGSGFGIDATGRTFLFFSSALWLAAGLCARSWVDRREGRFFVWFLLAMSGNLGLIVAGDMLGFYLFFALMSFAAYGLVVHRRSQAARRAGRIYLIFVLAGDMALFAGLVLLAVETGGQLFFSAARDVLPQLDQGNLIVALLVFGFGVKMGILGLHVTLPLIYQAAPTPAGVALAGAMLNAGLLGLLRLLPVESGALPGWGAAFVVAGTGAAFYGAAAGVLQRHARSVLAYSSISQMGIVSVGVGVALAADDGQGKMLSAVALYALHHAFAKGSLFLGTGIAERIGGRRPLLVAAGLLLPALAIAGAPLTSGMLAKETLKAALEVAPYAWQSPLKALLPWMAFATTVVLARYLWLVLRGTRGADDLSPGAGAGWAGLLLLTAAAAWLVADPVDGLWSISTVWAVTWPVVLGAGAACLPLLPGVAGRVPARLYLPAGDVLVLLETAGRRTLRVWASWAAGRLPELRDFLRRGVSRLAVGPSRWRALSSVEARLTDWPVAATLLALTVLAVWMLSQVSWGS